MKKPRKRTAEDYNTATTWGDKDARLYNAGRADMEAYMNFRVRKLRAESRATVIKLQGVEK